MSDEYFILMLVTTVDLTISDHVIKKNCSTFIMPWHAT